MQVGAEGLARTENSTWPHALSQRRRNDQDELHFRLDCIRADTGLRWSDLADVHLQSLLDADPTLGEFSKTKGRVIGTPLLDELEEQVRNCMIDMVILDTLSDVFAGDENDRQQARAFIRLLARLGLKTQSTMLALAHPSLTGMASGTGTSGSTGWSNATRARMYLHGDKDGDDGHPHPSSDEGQLQTKEPLRETPLAAWALRAGH